MDRSLSFAASAALVAALFAACVPSFQNRRTPSGDFCSDMPVIPAGQAPDREYHRLQPVASEPEARTEAERLESLRKAACRVGGDAVIEAANEEVRLSNATYGIVSSGTAIVWVRHGESEVTPLRTYPSKGPNTGAAATPPAAAPAAAPEAPAAAPEPEPAPAPAPAASGKAAASAPPAGSAKGAASASAPTPAPATSASAAPVGAGKKLPTKKQP